jgi:hypothetical protein
VYNEAMNKTLVVSIGKCEACGKTIKYGATFKGKVYGTDCFNEIAKEFIELRDKAISVEEMNKLADKYGVTSI